MPDVKKRTRPEVDPEALAAILKPRVKPSGAAFIDYSEHDKVTEAPCSVDRLRQESQLLRDLVAIDAFGVTKTAIEHTLDSIAPKHFSSDARRSWCIAMGRRIRNMCRHVTQAIARRP